MRYATCGVASVVSASYDECVWPVSAVGATELSAEECTVPIWNPGIGSGSCATRFPAELWHVCRSADGSVDHAMERRRCEQLVRVAKPSATGFHSE